MFAQFSEQLYRRLATREYRAVNAATEQLNPADTPLWTVGKVENATLCVLQVIDCARCNLETLRAEQPNRLAEAARRYADFRSVMLIHLLVSETPTTPVTANTPITANNEPALHALMNEADDYMGQTVYAVYWHAVLSTGECTAAKGQPSTLFGLRPLIMAAMEEMAMNDNAPRTFADIAREASVASPYNPRCRSAVWTWVLLTVNAMVVLLMYLDGYATDNLTALRFGALMPERVASGEYYRLFTAMFVHFGVLHFLMNALGLAIFGQRAERYFGRGPFLLLYGAAGLSASVASLLFTQGYAAGASGAVYGLVGALFVFTRISKRTVDQLNDYLMLVYITMGLAMGLLTPGIDNFGHVGGLLMGAALGAAFTITRKT